MKQRKRGPALLLALILTVSLAGCGGQGEAPAPTDAPAASPVPTETAAPSPTPAADEEDVLTLALTAAPSDLDPAAAATYQESTVFACLNEGLMKWADSGKSAEKGVNSAELVCGMAERYDRTDNGDGTVTYTFHLRADAKWSDGQTITAADFVYGWQRLFPHAVGAEWLSCVVNGPEIIAGSKLPEDLAVEAVDESTFAVTVHDVPWFLELCAMACTSPVRRDAAEQGSGWSQDPETAVANGPYRLKSVEQGLVTLEKNEYYYAPNENSPATLRFYFVNDAGAITSAFGQGTVDAAVGAGDKDAPRVSTLTSYYLFFQTQKAPFDDARVRRAFALAIDRDKLTAETVPGQTPAGALVPDGVTGDGEDFRAAGGNYIDPAKDAFSGNCDRARALLKEAGYPGGAGLDEVEYLYPDSATHRAVAQVLKETWEKELGVKVKLRGENWTNFLDACDKGEFAIARGRWAADYNDAAGFLELWREGAAGNYAGYANPRYDALMALASAGAKARTQRLQQAEELLVNEDSVIAPVYYETRPYLISDKVGGAYRNPLGVFFFASCVKK